MAAHSGDDHGAISAWVGSPLVAGLLILTVVATFYHAYLGVQVVIEDYVHSEGPKIAGLLIVQALCILLGLIGVLSVLSLLLGG